VIEAEARKVCERGHSAWGWRAWYRGSNTVLGHCVCGSPYRLETRGAPPLSKRGIVLAGDALAAEAPHLQDDVYAERLALVAIRAYLNTVEAA
jgi:hypothetical protein